MLFTSSFYNSPIETAYIPKSLKDPHSSRLDQYNSSILEPYIMKTTISILTSALVLSTSISAQEPKEVFLGGTFSGSASIATDSVFRGESTVVDGDIPAISAGFSWTHNDGFYVGVSGATSQYTSTPDIRSTVSPYIGKFGTLADTGINYNTVLYHYIYPGAEDSNYTELWIEADKDFGPVNLKVEVTPTLDDWFGVDGWSGVNYAIHPSTTFDNGITLSAAIGYQDLSGEDAEGWTHWNMGVSKTVYGLNLDLRYHDSDMDSSHKVYGSPEGIDIFEQRIVLGVSKSF